MDVFKGSLEFGLSFSIQIHPQVLRVRIVLFQKEKLSDLFLKIIC